MYYESEDEKKIIMSLLDLALKTGGLSAKDIVDKVIHSLRPYKSEVKDADIRV